MFKMWEIISDEEYNHIYYSPQVGNYGNIQQSWGEFFLKYIELCDRGIEFKIEDYYP